MFFTAEQTGDLKVLVLVAFEVTQSIIYAGIVR
jgi:hypothetical protein